MSADPEQLVAVVVIGRNEGERLKLSLGSALRSGCAMVYVDSASSDDSAAVAVHMGCSVVQMDAARPMSAARARNEGFAAAMKQMPQAEFVQFLDGDCEMAESWLANGVAALRERPEAAMVCGEVHEAAPNASVYNKLCELEWQQAPGEICACAGRFLIRSEVFRAVGGFREDVIAAEDDELCIRVRAAGWKIVQLDTSMATHDAAMTRFSQWWRRAQRTGHAYAQVSAMHGGSPEFYFVHERQRVWLWGLVLPLAAITLAPWTHGWSLMALVAAYAVQAARIYNYGRKRGWQPRDAAVYAAFTVLFKYPAVLGMSAFYTRRWRGRGYRIMEYKKMSE